MQSFYLNILISSNCYWMLYIQAVYIYQHVCCVTLRTERSLVTCTLSPRRQALSSSTKHHWASFYRRLTTDRFDWVDLWAMPSWAHCRSFSCACCRYHGSRRQATGYVYGACMLLMLVVDDWWIFINDSSHPVIGDRAVSLPVRWRLAVRADLHAGVVFTSCQR